MRYLILLLLAFPGGLAGQDPDKSTPPAAVIEPANATVDEADSGARPSDPIPSYPENNSEVKRFDSSSVFFDSVGKLMIVLGLVVLVGYLARKFLPSRFGGSLQGENLRLIQSLPMGPRRFVSLIEADGRRFLIGVTENQINLIKALDEDVFAQTLEDVSDPKRVSDLIEAQT